jgi:hypothetical protein
MSENVVLKEAKLKQKAWNKKVNGILVSRDNSITVL